MPCGKVPRDAAELRDSPSSFYFIIWQNHAFTLEVRCNAVIRIMQIVDVAGCHFEVEVNDDIISVVVGELIHIMKGLLRAVVQIVFHTGI
jgi:hypothetical protein